MDHSFRVIKANRHLANPNCHYSIADDRVAVPRARLRRSTALEPYPILPPFPSGKSGGRRNSRLDVVCEHHAIKPREIGFDADGPISVSGEQGRHRLALVMTDLEQQQPAR